LVGLIVAGASAEAKGKDALLSAPQGKVFEVLAEALASEYRIEQVSKDSGTISFRTGASMSSLKGQDGSCIVLAVEDGAKSRVVCNTEKRGSAFSWGEGGKIQEKVLKLLTKALHAKGLIPASEVVK